MVQAPSDLASRQQASLRRVAALVARGAESSQVFEAVAREVAEITGSALVQIQRFEPDDTVIVAGAWGARPHPFKPGSKWSLEGSQIAAKIKRTGEVVRIDDFGAGSGQIQAGVRKTGIRGGAGAPIFVAGELWGVMAAGPAQGEPVPVGLEDVLAGFTELAATAIASTESRAALAGLADEQAALRRVATLVAQGEAPEQVFAAVGDELAALVGAEMLMMIRYDDVGGAYTVLAAGGRAGEGASPGTRLELGGRNVTTTVHETGRPARIDDYGTASGAPGAYANRFATRSAVGCPVIVDGRVWGAVIGASRGPEPLPPQTEARMSEFTDLMSTAIANTEARAEVQRLVDEQAALRRVAMLVAQNVPPDEVVSNIVEEVGVLLGVEAVGLGRFDPDGTVTTLAMWSVGGDATFPPERVPLQPGGLTHTIARTGEPARIDDWQGRAGIPATVVRDQMGMRSSVGVPIKVGDEVWGAIAVHAAHVIAPDTESRLERFAGPLATALTNAQARHEVRRLVDEQAALRRVATLVAREATPARVFNAVAEEIGRLLGIEDTGMVRYEPDDTATVVATSGGLNSPELVGRRMTLGGNNTVTKVWTTGRAVRVHDHSGSSGEIGEYVRSVGARSTVGSPIVVGGRLWGAMLVTSATGSLPPETEDRVGEFTELVATAIANVEAHEELAASRARLVAAADEERRRVVRDLHDGAQQRLVHTVISLKLAERALADDPATARTLVAEALENAENANAELRELAQGIMPGVLTRGGLRAGVESLVSRMPIPVAVDVEVPARRLSSVVEATAYFVVAEALTNVVKHAHAREANVTARVEDSRLHVEVRDDGEGGARPDGSGLVGLRDRVAAQRGELVVESAPGEGTRVVATIALPDGSTGPDG